MLALCTGWAKKRATLLLSISLPIIDRFSKFFHWHTLQTICVSTVPCEISMKYAYITIITKKHFGKIEKLPLQTNIAVNGLYDTKLCGSNTVYCHMNHSSQCWSEAFFFIYLNFCYHC